MKKINLYDLPAVPEANAIYHLLPVRNDANPNFYYERTNRNIGWITPEEQEILRSDSVIAIAGCGGMGGELGPIFVRLGVRELRFGDTEKFDVTNLNRQYAATMATLGKSKAISTAHNVRAIANDTNVIVYSQGITKETVEDFCKGCHVICDEIEFFSVHARILLHQAMRKYDGVILNSSTIGHRLYITKFTKESMWIEELLEMTLEEAEYLENAIHSKQATEEEKARVTYAMLRVAAPVVPEYSAQPEIYSTASNFIDSLLHDSRAGVLSTNPPMATGFLANRALMEILIQKSDLPRNFSPLPLMPGYFTFDAGLLTCERVEKKWW